MDTIRRHEASKKSAAKPEKRSYDIFSKMNSISKVQMKNHSIRFMIPEAIEATPRYSCITTVNVCIHMCIHTCVNEYKCLEVSCFDVCSWMQAESTVTWPVGVCSMYAVCVYLYVCMYVSLFYESWIAMYVYMFTMYLYEPLLIQHPHPHAHVWL